MCMVTAEDVMRPKSVASIDRDPRVYADRLSCDATSMSTPEVDPAMNDVVDPASTKPARPPAMSSAPYGKPRQKSCMSDTHTACPGR